MLLNAIQSMPCLFGAFRKGEHRRDSETTWIQTIVVKSDLSFVWSLGCFQKVWTRLDLEKIEDQKGLGWNLCPATMSTFLSSNMSFPSEFPEFHEFSETDELAHSVTNHVMNDSVELNYVYSYDHDDCDPEFMTAEQEALDAYIDYMLDMDYDW
jgi:hypothetical protein